MSEKTTTTGRSKTAVAIDRILEMIEGSSLKPGDRLPSERALAADLRVSRATVREAIMALQIAGRLESRSGDGTYILERPINIGDDETKLRAGVDITEALEYRMAIEISASIMACRRARKSDIMRMQAVLEAMAEFVAEEDYESYLDSSMDLHLAIGKASHSKQLRSVHDALTEQVRDEACRTSRWRWCRWRSSRPPRPPADRRISAGSPSGRSLPRSRHWLLRSR